MLSREWGFALFARAPPVGSRAYHYELTRGRMVTWLFFSEVEETNLVPRVFSAILKAEKTLGTKLRRNIRKSFAT